MNDETWVRKYVRRILSEETGEDKDKDKGEDLPKTTGPGPGRFKKEFRDLKALADADPQKLMQNLGISGVGGSDQGEAVNILMNSAISGEEMAAVYSGVKKLEDPYGRKGARVSLTGEMSPRDALAFARETVKGAENSGILPFNEKIQVEILEKNILVYVSSRSFQWNKKKTSRR
jgi:hypothetical protein